MAPGVPPPRGWCCGLVKILALGWFGGHSSEACPVCLEMVVMNTSGGLRPLWSGCSM